jgi:hypothetical protein
MSLLVYTSGMLRKTEYAMDSVEGQAILRDIKEHFDFDGNIVAVGEHGNGIYAVYFYGVPVTSPVDFSGFTPDPEVSEIVSLKLNHVTGTAIGKVYYAGNRVGVSSDHNIVGSAEYTDGSGKTVYYFDDESSASSKNVLIDFGMKKFWGHTTYQDGSSSISEYIQQP